MVTVMWERHVHAGTLEAIKAIKPSYVLVCINGDVWALTSRGHAVFMEAITIDYAALAVIQKNKSMSMEADVKQIYTVRLI